MLIFLFSAFAGGIVFGWLQCRLLRRIARPKSASRPMWLLAVKLLAWGLAMTAVAFWSIPALIAFVAGATLFMISTVIYAWCKSRKED